MNDTTMTTTPRNDSTMRKAIGYAYPTSPTAKQHKQSAGCWTVDLWQWERVHWTVKAFATKAEAIAAAEAMDLEWSKYCGVHGTHKLGV